MPETFLPNIFDTPEMEMAEKILNLATQYPHVFKILPINSYPEDFNPDDDIYKGIWSRYNLDLKSSLWVDTSHPVAIDLYRETFNQKKERTMATAITVREQDTVKQLLTNNFKAFKSVLPKHLTPERMIRIAFQTIVRNPNLARCTQTSLIDALISASIVGFEVGGPLANAHLVPFKNNKLNIYEVELIINYKGFIELFYKSPQVKNVQAHPVYANDEFEYEYGTNPHIFHKPADMGDRGKLIYAYCIVFYRSGGFDYEVVNEEVAMDAKNHSKAKNSKDSPWNKKDQEWTMWVKTAVRIISKRVPKSPELMKAIAIEDRAEGLEDIDLKDIIDADFTIQTGEKKPENGKKPADVPMDKTEPEQPEIPNIFQAPAGFERLPEKEKKSVQALLVAVESFPDQALKAIEELKINPDDDLTYDAAVAIVKKIGSIIDMENA